MFLKIKKSLGTPQSQNKTFKNYKIVIKIELQKNFKGSEIWAKMVLKILEKMQKGLKHPKISLKVSNIHIFVLRYFPNKKATDQIWNLIELSMESDCEWQLQKEPHPIVVAWPPL